MNIFKAWMIVPMVFKTITGRYIIKSLTRDIRYRVIYNIKFTPIKWQNYITCILLNDTFSLCVQSSNTVFRCLLTLVITTWKVFTAINYINIYSYDITRAYQSCILLYSTGFLLLIKCVYSNIQAYPPHVYYSVLFSRYWSNVVTVTYRPIHPVCTI